MTFPDNWPTARNSPRVEVYAPPSRKPSMEKTLHGLKARMVFLDEQLTYAKSEFVTNLIQRSRESTLARIERIEAELKEHEHA